MKTYCFFLRNSKHQDNWVGRVNLKLNNHNLHPTHLGIVSDTFLGEAENDDLMILVNTEDPRRILRFRDEIGFDLVSSFVLSPI